jgi:putative flavoprotein involved in K+ transport
MNYTVRGQGPLMAVSAPSGSGARRHRRKPRRVAILTAFLPSACAHRGRSGRWHRRARAPNVTPMSAREARPRAVVVGAGPAGLAAAIRLERRFPGHGDVVVLERSIVAASWRARYAELRLNTTRSTSALPGRPIPRWAGRWPSRDHYVEYLQAAASSLRTAPRTGVTALRVLRDPRSGWIVKTDVDAHVSPNVVVATGHNAIAHTPDWADGALYQGEVRHVADLQRLADFVGRRVLVVGGGNSGVGIAGHLAAEGVEVVVAMRTPPTILPREHLGIPLQRVAVATRWLPVRTPGALALSTARMAIGDLTPVVELVPSSTGV